MMSSSSITLRKRLLGLLSFAFSFCSSRSCSSSSFLDFPFLEVSLVGIGTPRPGNIGGEIGAIATRSVSLRAVGGFGRSGDFSAVVGTRIGRGGSLGAVIPRSINTESLTGNGRDG